MPLTPEQFNLLTTKADFNELRNEVKELKDEVHKVVNTLDKVAQQLNNIEQSFVFNMAAHDRFEIRISTVEKKLNLPTGFGV